MYIISFDPSDQSLSHVRLFATPWTAAHQASLSITKAWSLPKPMSAIELVILFFKENRCSEILVSEFGLFFYNGLMSRFMLKQLLSRFYFI